jgi:hypothetical protein
LKETYAVRRSVPPSAEIEARIDQLLAVGVGENPRETLSELAKLGARLIIQRAVEDEFDAWLGRARYERRPDYQRGLRNYDSGLRNGFRPRTVQTAEGELEIEIPQVREAAEPLWAMPEIVLNAPDATTTYATASCRKQESASLGVGRLRRTTSKSAERSARTPASHWPSRCLRTPSWRTCCSSIPSVISVRSETTASRRGCRVSPLR